MSLYVLVNSSNAIGFDRNECKIRISFHFFVLQSVSTTHWLYFSFLERMFSSHVTELLIHEVGLGNTGKELKRRSS